MDDQPNYDNQYQPIPPMDSDISVNGHFFPLFFNTG